MHDHETFWTLVRDAAHWQFELFVSFVWMLGEGLILWPIVRRVSKILRHHKVDDADIASLKAEVAKLRARIDAMEKGA